MQGCVDVNRTRMTLMLRIKADLICAYQSYPCHLCSIVFVLLFFSGSAFSQNCPKSENKKAVKAYQQAADLFKARKDYDKVRKLLEEAIDEDPEFADAYLLQ